MIKFMDVDKQHHKQTCKIQWAMLPHLNFNPAYILRSPLNNQISDDISYA